MKNEQDTTALFSMISAVSPALASYTQKHVVDELWNRPGLSPRDRALVTLSALVSRNATLAYPHYFNKALDAGLTPTEISELLTHLGFYASLANAFGAIAIVREVFSQRGITPDTLPPIAPELLPIEMVIPKGSALTSAIAENIGLVSPALQHFTNDLLYNEVWRRPGLAPRDRSLATVMSLAAMGQAEMIPAYVKQAIHHGITQEEIGESLAHIAFYCGWGLAVPAAQAVKRSFMQ